MIHSVAHFANAINFVRKYDARMSEINWARDDDDVRSTTVLEGAASINHFLLRSVNPTECFPLDVFDTGWILRLDDDGVSGHHLDFFDTSDA